MITSKERFKKACQYSTPDRPPIINILGQNMVWEKLYNYYDIQLPVDCLASDQPGLRFYGLDDETHERFMQRIGQDFRVINPDYVGPAMKVNEDGSWVDLWGTTYKWEPFNGGLYETPIGLPFAGIESVEELADYPFPSADWYDYDTVPEYCNKYKDYALITGGPGCLDFINGIAFGRGVEQVLIDIAMEDPVYLFLVEKRFEFFYNHIKRILEKAQGAIDVVHVGDDLGTQNAPIISPAVFEKLHAPYYKKFFEMVHSFGAKTCMHSCGSVREFIPLLIDIGLDILDVVQVDAVNMDLESLHKEFSKKIMFSGTLSLQNLLSKSTPKEIWDTIMDIRRMFEDGGIMLGPCNIMQMDMPPKNFDTMIRAILAPLDADYCDSVK